eukprot:c32742_g1_i1 orf=100-324(+)
MHRRIEIQTYTQGEAPNNAEIIEYGQILPYVPERQKNKCSLLKTRSRKKIYKLVVACEVACSACSTKILARHKL